MPRGSEPDNFNPNQFGPWLLTPRELEILEWVAEGKTAYEIGIILGISKRTVEEHTSHLVEKLGATNKTQAVAIALRTGLL